MPQRKKADADILCEQPKSRSGIGVAVTHAKASCVFMHRELIPEYWMNPDPLNRELRLVTRLGIIFSCISASATKIARNMRHISTEKLCHNSQHLTDALVACGATHSEPDVLGTAVGRRFFMKIHGKIGQPPKKPEHSETRLF